MVLLSVIALIIPAAHAGVLENGWREANSFVQDVQKQGGFPTARQAAEEEGLTVLKKVVRDDSSAKGYGFQSAAEVSRARLGKSFPNYFVGLSQLGTYHRGDHVARELHQETFLVTVNDEPRCLIRVGEQRPDAQGQWELISIGDSELAKAIAKYGNGEPQFLVEIPALLFDFLGNGLTTGLTNLFDIPGTAFKAGDTKSAEDWFEMLAPLARKRLETSPNAPGGR